MICLDPGITPAPAGNRATYVWGKAWWEDHPRPCGEQSEC